MESFTGRLPLHLSFYVTDPEIVEICYNENSIDGEKIYPFAGLLLGVWTVIEREEDVDFLKKGRMDNKFSASLLFYRGFDEPSAGSFFSVCLILSFLVIKFVFLKFGK